MSGPMNGLARLEQALAPEDRARLLTESWELVLLVDRVASRSLQLGFIGAVERATAALPKTKETSLTMRYWPPPETPRALQSFLFDALERLLHGMAGGDDRACATAHQDLVLGLVVLVRAWGGPRRVHRRGHQFLVPAGDELRVVLDLDGGSMDFRGRVFRLLSILFEAACEHGATFPSERSPGVPRSSGVGP